MTTPVKYGGRGLGPVLHAVLERERAAWYRERRVLLIYKGTDEIQRRTIRCNLLRGRAVPGAIGEG